MNVFDHPEFDNHEEVCFFCDDVTGLKAITAIHTSRPLGKAGGGCRMYPYASSDDALRDVLRLSRAMSFKLALFKIPSGGAKTVIIGDPRKDKTEALLRSLGRYINTLGGRYTIAEDVGTTPEDMKIIGKETPYVVHRGEDQPAAEALEAPATGYGVFVGLRTSVARHLGRNSLDGVKVAVQGLGHVGWHLCNHLHEAGAQLIVTDINAQAVERAVGQFGATPVAPDVIHSQEVDVFAPCAMADAIHDGNIDELRCRVVCGGANNQLSHAGLASTLHERGILYAPDFVVNAGGVIAASYAALGLTDDKGRQKSMRGIEAIGPVLDEVIACAREDGVDMNEAGERVARRRLL